VKSIKTLLTGAIVAGLLLMSAGGAQAAYTGLYTSSGNPNVTLNGNTSFLIGTAQYNIDRNNYLWSADGGGGYFYGASLDTSAVSGILASLPSGITSSLNIPDTPFGFIKSSYEFNETITDTINASVSSFIGSSMIAAQAFRASPVLAGTLYGGDLQSVLTGYAQDLLADLSAYDLTGASIGYGFFYDNGDKFDVSLGSLDEAGLVALFDGADVNTYIKATPIPGAVWLLGSGLVGLAGLRRRMRG